MSIVATYPQRIPADFELAQMSEHDLIEVVEIEQQSGLSRWGWGAYYAELQSSNRIFMIVARWTRQPVSSDSTIAGYIVARLAADEMHINNVAVREIERRRGIGSALLNHVIFQAKKKGARVAFLEVRAGNTAALTLYEKCGFKVIARRDDYYSDPREDALVMSMVL
jgi:ribosomal-protein-alanine N-acetyltransferase